MEALLLQFWLETGTGFVCSPIRSSWRDRCNFSSSHAIAPGGNLKSYYLAAELGVGGGGYSWATAQAVPLVDLEVTRIVECDHFPFISVL